MRIISLLLLLVSFFTNGQLELNNLFTDNMVLQRSSNVNIWGKSSPNQVIKVYSSWNKTSTKTKADNNGDWILNPLNEAWNIQKQLFSCLKLFVII